MGPKVNPRAMGMGVKPPPALSCVFLRGEAGLLGANVQHNELGFTTNLEVIMQMYNKNDWMNKCTNPALFK